jgi:hypothetical protein
MYLVFAASCIHFITALMTFCYAIVSSFFFLLSKIITDLEDDLILGDVAQCSLLENG